MHRSDPKRAFLVQQQISELGPEDAHRVFQQRLKYRLQFTGRKLLHCNKSRKTARNSHRA